MNELVAELRAAHDKARSFAAKINESAMSAALTALLESAQEVGQMWSGSWLGYHALVYYNGLTPPPAGAHFSREWGFIDAMTTDTRGNWKEYKSEFIIQQIEARAGNPDLTPIRQLAQQAEKLFEESKSQIVSILTVAHSHRSTDPFIDELLEEAKKAFVPTVDQLFEALMPTGYIGTRDSRAADQGVWKPPHIAVQVSVISLKAPFEVCGKVADIAQKAASHLQRVARDQRRAAPVGTKVFIGHGRSQVWRALKDFVQDRLHLESDEFNRVSSAGITNTARLSQMLDASAFAFVIMTAEDEQAGGTVQARMNVIHEVGLFQGHLGFTKAIVLLEDGCEEFSNIQGLGQIRFPKGDIGPKLEEVRMVLEREGIISA